MNILTDISMIQNAYQGFAKQNYTMLDNLKLGYGGTKTEMERLIADAAKMTDVQKELGITITDGDMSFANIANAISVVQSKMGIMNATLDESQKTITGSTGAMKAAWQNLVTGIADDNADFETLVNNLVVSIVGTNGEGGFINNMLPRIQTALDGIVKMVVSLTDTLLPQITVLGMDLIMNLVGSLNENMPALLVSASAILDTLISGILSLLPSLLPVVISLIETLCFSILENLPMVLDAGISILVALAQGIASMLPDLIPLAISAILNLVETLLDNTDLLIDAGIEIIFALVEGLISSLPTLLEKTPIIIGKLVSGLISGVHKLRTAGGDLLDGLFEGLLNPTAIWNAVKSLFNGIVGGVKSIFGIHSPSTVFRDVVGQNLALGLGEGFTDTMDNVSKDMGNAVPTNFEAGLNVNVGDAIPTEFDTNMNANASSSYGSNYDYMVSAFKQALQEVKVVMNNREMGAFVTETMERAVYS